MPLRNTTLVLIVFLTGCARTSSRPPVEKAPDLSPALDCPVIGSELELCDGSTVKLLAADFYRSIGSKGTTVDSAPDAVFCVIRIEWIESGDPAPPVPDLENGEGVKLPRSSRALEAFLALQPDGHFLDRQKEFQPDRLEAVVYELNMQAAASGLFVTWPDSCARPTGSDRFCLGKYRF